VTWLVRRMEAELRAKGQRVCLVIATDGKSGDGSIAKTMKPLEKLPVWVVIKLCTDDSDVVHYWNNVDEQLDLDLDVLNDLRGEAVRVHGCNPWLTYGQPLHRLREFGVVSKEIDMLDSRTLTLDQIRLFCGLL
jgi:hypothetical protein